MIAVLDSNVLYSALAFGGVPGRVLEQWGSGRYKIAISENVVSEYREVGRRLLARYPWIDFPQAIELVVRNADVVILTEPPVRACRDPDDDKFIACVVAAGAVVVSGDKDLLAISGILGVKVVSPRSFLASLQ